MDIQETGVYWKVDSNNNLVNNYDKVELDLQLNAICDLFVKEIQEFVKESCEEEIDIHSAYLSGSCLNGNTCVHSDINFLVLGPDSGSEELMPYFNSHVSQLIKDKFDIEIGVNVVIESVEFFLEDYLERFPIKCIYGVDLSLNVLNFDLITNECLDGTEREDCKYLLDSLNYAMMSATSKDIVGGNEWFVVGPAFIKNLFRCAFNSICKEKKIWTRDLYYCYKFFVEEYPQFEQHMIALLDLYLNPNKSSEEIKDVLTLSLDIIDHMSKIIEKTE